jgi:predicted CXXCH cytochrome family protein
MIRKGPNKHILLIVIGVLILCLSGCNQNTKQKMLNFFFTGVPTPEEIERQKKEAEEKRKRKEGEKKPSETGIAKISEVRSKEKEVSIKTQKVYSHTPYTEGRCNGCHRSSSGSFTVFRSKKSSSTFSEGGGKPGVLVAPRKKLCIKCHEYLTPDKALLSGLWLHTTAAEGDCDACHAPHQSGYPSILLSKPGEICQECHSDEKTMNIPDHSKPGECLDCHNPHLGKNRLLLKKDYQEEQHPVKQLLDSPDSKSLSDSIEKEMNPQSKTEILKSGDPVGSGK